MAGAISVSRNPVIKRKIFSVFVSSHLDASDLGPSLDLDANGHQSLF